MSYEKRYHKCECGNIHSTYINTTCDSCGNVLTPVFSGGKEPAYLQLDDVLHIKLEGQYGEYLDTEAEFNGEVHVLLCHDCARAFFENNSWMIKLLPAYAQDRLLKSGRIELEPTCDICNEPQHCGRESCEHAADWNGETGNHLSCEKK